MEKAKKQTFNSGVLEIWEGTISPSPVLAYPRIKYALRTVGSRRAFDAQQAGHTIAKMVRIPCVPGAWNDRFVVENGTRYEIVQVQDILDTCPNCLQISLELPNIGWAQSREG